MTSKDFVKQTERVLMSVYQADLVPVSDSFGKGKGMDFIIQSDAAVIRIPGDMPKSMDQEKFEDTVKNQIKTELERFDSNRLLAQEITGTSIRKWIMILPQEPTTVIKRSASQRKRTYKIDIEILGPSQLKKWQKQIGFDPHEESWDRLRIEMQSLKKHEIFGKFTLDYIFIEPEISAVFPLEEENRAEILFPFKPAIRYLKEFIHTGHFNGHRRYSSHPVIIFGQDGAGKTSLLKMLTVELAEDANATVPVFLPLRKVCRDPDVSFMQSIRNYLYLQYNIKLEEIDLMHRPICWLLDGFDEINLMHSGDPGWIQERYREIQSLAQHENSIVLLSARPILFMNEPANLDHQTARIDICPFDEDRMELWIEKWKNLPGHADSAITLQGLWKRNLFSEAQTPLILFMAACLFDDALECERPYLRVEIFKLFIDAAEQRKLFNDLGLIPPPKKIKFFRQTLQNIAFVIFQHAEAGFIEFNQLKSKIDDCSLLMKLDKEELLQPLINTSFLLKKEKTPPLKYVEFTHQSFREYLVVEKFVTFLEKAGTPDLTESQWAIWCQKFFTSSKLHFLAQSICLLNLETRIRIFDTMRDIVMNPVLQQTSILQRIIAYFICSGIAAYGSETLRESVDFPDPAALNRLYHAACTFPAGSMPVQAWKLMIQSLPGGIVGPGTPWDSTEIQLEHLYNMAFLAPRTYTLGITSHRISTCLFYLKEYQTLIISSNQMEHCVCQNCNILFTGKSHRLSSCAFLNCNFLFLNPEVIMDVSDCSFLQCTGPDHFREKFSQQHDDQRIGDLISRAVTALRESIRTIPCSNLIPWGDIVYRDVLGFAEVVFSVDQDHARELLEFMPIMRRTAIEKESD